MQIVEKKVSELKAYEKNPRKNDEAVAPVAESIKQFGFKVPIIIDKDNIIVAGHTRLKAAKKLGMKTVPCIVADDLTPQQIKAFRVADNSSAQIASWDLTLLKDELMDIDFDMALFGLEKDIFAPEIIEDDVPEVDEKNIITKPGDIWKLGDHLLMCGDSTKPEEIAKLMGKERAQVAVTSPPYGVGKEYEQKGIEPWMAIVQPVIKNITKYADIVCWNLGDLYPTGTQYIEPTNVYSVNFFQECGFRPIWIRIWKKQGMNFGVGPYHLVTNKPVQQYEYITAFGNNAEPEYNDQEYVWLSAYAAHSFQFVKRLSKEERKKWGYAGIWEIATVKANKEHPAMYPVELPWRCIKMHSDKGEIVLEPFSGSGTTIIACEQTGRRCRAMEITPEYCDVDIRRWEAFTGQKAVLL
jgi:DNA modification methylase